MIFIGGLSGTKDFQTEEWNGKGCVRHIGLQQVMSSFTETMSFDWPGTGRSLSVKTFPTTMEEEAMLVQTLAAQKSVLPPYILVAQHIGCYTAITYAMQNPKQVKALVLIHPPPVSAYSPKVLTKSYVEKYPSAAGRIRAFLASKDKWPRVFKSSKVMVHVDMVPKEAPKTMHEENEKALVELEKLFPNRIYHYGASVRIHRNDPYPILATIIRFMKAKERHKTVRKMQRMAKIIVKSPPRKRV